MKIFAALAACTTALNFDLSTMMMMQSMNGGATDMFSNPLLMLSLLNDDSSSTSTDKTGLDDPLMMMMLMGGNMGDMGSMLPFLLMQDGEMDDDMLMLMMMSGGNMFGGAAPAMGAAPLMTGDLAQNPALMSVLLGRK